MLQVFDYIFAQIKNICKVKLLKKNLAMAYESDPRLSPEMNNWLRQKKEDDRQYRRNVVLPTVSLIAAGILFIVSLCSKPNNQSSINQENGENTELYQTPDTLR